MNTKRLHEILRETTSQLRKGEVVEGSPDLVAQMKAGVDLDKLAGGGVLEIYDMPHVDQVKPDIEKVDVEFIVVGVDRKAAERHRDELVAILRTWPDPDRLAGGPSYIEVGAVLDDQGAAFMLFALGKVLGLWDIITPATMGFTGPEARQLAENGFIMISGFRPDRPSAEAA